MEYTYSCFPPCGHESTRWKHSISTIWGLTTMLSFLTHEVKKLLFIEWQVFWLTLHLIGPSRRFLFRQWFVIGLLIRCYIELHSSGTVRDLHPIPFQSSSVDHGFRTNSGTNIEKYWIEWILFARKVQFCAMTTNGALFQNKCHIDETQIDCRLFFFTNKRA